MSLVTRVDSESPAGDRGRFDADEVGLVRQVPGSHRQIERLEEIGLAVDEFGAVRARRHSTLGHRRCRRLRRRPRARRSPRTTSSREPCGTRSIPGRRHGSPGRCRLRPTASGRRVCPPPQSAAASSTPTRSGAPWVRVRTASHLSLRPTMRRRVPLADPIVAHCRPTGKGPRSSAIRRSALASGCCGGDTRGMTNHWIVGVDGSSVDALRLALHHAPTRGVEVTAVTAFHVPAVMAMLTAKRGFGVDELGLGATAGHELDVASSTSRGRSRDTDSRRGTGCARARRCCR